MDITIFYPLLIHHPAAASATTTTTTTAHHAILIERPEGSQAHLLGQHGSLFHIQSVAVL